LSTISFRGDHQASREIKQERMVDVAVQGPVHSEHEPSHTTSFLTGHIRAVFSDAAVNLGEPLWRGPAISLQVFVLVAYRQLADTLTRALENVGLEAGRAQHAGQIIAGSTRDGVPSHGLNLFPRLIAMIRNGIVNVDARPRRVTAAGGLERWDGGGGVGVLNAWESMDGAIASARVHGIGCVALANTNHWMRGGTYGWQAADAGVIGICWTNTLPNLPPWGDDQPRIGNNPLVIALPRPDGHLVLDMALSQFSYGTLAAYRARGETLPVPGGFDASGGLTRDPAAIETSHRPLPIGFWKGTGLSIMLDAIAASLAAGRATHQVTAEPEQETNLSQVFIAIDAAALGSREEIAHIADAIVADLRTRYPGRRALDARRKHARDGIPVDDAAWDFARSCAKG
jgi:3-dehydro-L-gulonate 2-dehydrogenase